MRRLIAIMMLIAALLALNIACLAEEVEASPAATSEWPDATAVPIEAESEAEPESEPEETALQASPGAVPAPSLATPTEPVILMSDPPQGTEMAVGGLFSSGSTVLGSDVPRASITEIRFQDTIFAAPDEAWDVSAAQNFSVLAWVEGGTLTIAGEGGVWANEDSTGLFADYAALEKIEFNGCFHAERAINLSRLFEGDWKLKEIDTSGWNASAATDMSYMFSSCMALTELDLSGLDTASATSMEGMFLMDASLESLDLSGFRADAIENASGMFEGCAALKSLSTDGFEFTRAANMARMFAGCAALETVDVGETFPEADARDMFEDCPAKLSVGGMEMSAEDWSRLGERVGLHRGSNGENVRWLQRKLLAAGCEVGSVDGSFGPATEAALIAWQTDKGFEATGETDQAQVLELMKIPDPVE